MFCYDWQRDVEVTVKKLRKPATVYKIAPSGLYPHFFKVYPKIFCKSGPRKTDRQTDETERPTHSGGYTAGVGNDRQQSLFRFA